MSDKIEQLFPNRKRITNAELLRATIEVLPDTNERLAALNRMPVPPRKELKQMSAREFSALFKAGMKLGGHLPSGLVPHLTRLLLEKIRRTFLT